MRKELGPSTRTMVGTIMKSAGKLKIQMAPLEVQVTLGRITTLLKKNKKITRRAMAVTKKMRHKSHRTMLKASQKDGITIIRKMMTHHPFLIGALTAHHRRNQMIPESEDH